jgi:hypothetical protein
MEKARDLGSDRGYREGIGFCRADQLRRWMEIPHLKIEGCGTQVPPFNFDRE